LELSKAVAHKSVVSGEICYQMLEDHLFNVAINASKDAKPYGLESTLFLVGILHDLGKAQSAFYEYITKDTQAHVVHSSAGGKAISDICETIKNSESTRYDQIDLFKEITCYTIFAHHGLMDVINEKDAADNFLVRLNYAVTDNNYEREILPCLQELEMYLIKRGYDSIEEIVIKSYVEICSIMNEKFDGLVKSVDSKKEQKKIKIFYAGCLVRLILSFLKNADINDSIAVEQPELIKEICAREYEVFFNNAHINIEKVYSEFAKHEQSELSKIRSQISEDAKNISTKNEMGIFTMEVPTGGGKTLTTLRYAINNAKQFKKDRIFYITAYLSVLEQNAGEIKRVINNDDFVLEHHSNVVKDYGEGNENEDDQPKFMWQQYLEDSWEQPVVLTTMVQLFNTLFKGKSNNLRRFNQLKNAVIIFDEIQSLPIKAVYNFNLMANFLKTVMNCNIVLCSATQPLLDDESIDYKIRYGNKDSVDKDLISLNKKQKQLFERVDFINKTGNNATDIMSTTDLQSLVMDCVDKYDNVLIVLNTKKAVKALYEDVSKIFDGRLVYLSTNMCASHRLEVIRDLKLSLKRGEKIICISTQLIEAGVDIDFNTVIRSLAGIDSIIQAAGRCNRENRLEKGLVYLINYAEENLKMLQDIKATVDSCQGALRTYRKKHGEGDLNMDILQQIYYQKYYDDKNTAMVYAVGKDGTNILEWLSDNKLSANEYRANSGKPFQRQLRQAFKSAANAFNLIDNQTQGIIVPYKNEALLTKLNEANQNSDYRTIKKTLRQLQSYTVNVYNLDEFKNACSIYQNYDGEAIAFILDEANYDRTIGVVLEGNYPAENFVI
jgi:CRISPR-associated helicase Cas3/CRISPR-associated endonuclease Cas3-HD